jgi:hypothetical protein
LFAQTRTGYFSGKIVSTDGNIYEALFVAVDVISGFRVSYSTADAALQRGAHRGMEDAWVSPVCPDGAF